MRQGLLIVALLLAGTGTAVGDPGRPDRLEVPFDVSSSALRGVPLAAGSVDSTIAVPLAEAPPDGPIAGALAAFDTVLEKLGFSKDDLAEMLSDVEISGFDDNWREERSGELGLSFGVGDRLEVGPSIGLTHEEENLNGVDEEWSQQVKVGARLRF
jgi:hypothetical protein